MNRIQNDDWFWTPGWQEGEHRADEDIRCGRYTEVLSIHELLDYLDQLLEDKK